MGCHLQLVSFTNELVAKQISLSPKVGNEVDLATANYFRLTLGVEKDKAINMSL